jgi:hypothetical protein
LVLWLASWRHSLVLRLPSRRSDSSNDWCPLLSRLGLDVSHWLLLLRSDISNRLRLRLRLDVPDRLWLSWGYVSDRLRLWLCRRLSNISDWLGLNWSRLSWCHISHRLRLRCWFNRSSNHSGLRLGWLNYRDNLRLRWLSDGYNLWCRRIRCLHTLADHRSWSRLGNSWSFLNWLCFSFDWPGVFVLYSVFKALFLAQVAAQTTQDHAEDSPNGGNDQLPGSPACVVGLATSTEGP